MKVILDENVKENKYILQVGDLVEGVNDILYIVIEQWDNKNSPRYILWSLDGDSGYDGYYDTLEDLTYSLVEDERIFKASEYELRLVKKGE